MDLEQKNYIEQFKILLSWQMSNITILLPSSLDLDNIILKTKLAGTPGFHKDKLAYLIYVIYSVGSRNFEKFEIDGFAQLQTIILNRVTRNCGDYYKKLQAEKIISIKEGYSGNKHSRGYKLLPPYNKEQVVNYIITDNVTKRGIRNAWRDLKNQNLESLEDYEHLTKWYTEKLTIDISLAEEFCDIYHSYRLLIQAENMKKVVQEWFDRMDKNGYSGCDNHFNQMEEDKRWAKAFSYMEKLLKFGIIDILNCEYSLKVDNTSFRLHGTLTRLKSELRNLLFYDGKQLVSLDLKNSQPFFSLALLNKNFWKDPNTTVGKTSTKDAYCNILNIHDFTHISSQLNGTVTKRMSTKVRQLAKEMGIDPEIGKIDTQIGSLIMFAISSNLTVRKHAQKYIKLVENGNIYEFMANMFNKTSHVKIDRSEAKGMMFITLFSSNQYKQQKGAEGKLLFMKLFPLLEDIFEIIKNKNKSLLAILLQTLESHLFLKVITKRIANERTELPIFTVHDSIITTLGDEDYVKRVMIEELEKAVGHTPQIKIEYYNPENFHKETLKYSQTHQTI